MKDNSGPAFPSKLVDDQGRGRVDLGLSKREWLAGMAMQGYGFDPQSKPEWIAKWAFEVADKMLEEGAK